MTPTSDSTPPPGTSATGQRDRRLVAALERVAQALRVRTQEQATAHALSPLQVQLLRLLRDAPTIRRRVTALARELDLSQPTVSDAVAALVAKGLVARIESAQDRRVLELGLTPDGAEVSARLAEDAAFIEHALAGLPDDGKDAALELLLHLIAELQHVGVVTVARMCTTCRFFARDRHAQSAAPHHCKLLDQPLGPATLRVDCPEHEAAQQG